MSERLLSATQAADLFGVPAAVIWRWRREGKIEPQDVVRGRGLGGVEWLYSPAELEPLVTRYLARRRPS